MKAALKIILLAAAFWAQVPIYCVAAESVNVKMLFNRITHAETTPVGDVKYHSIMLLVREGVAVFENGDFAEAKSSLILDFVNGAGTFEVYLTCAFRDGSMIKIHSRGAAKGTADAVAATSKLTGDIIEGAGRFAGARGTFTSSTNVVLPTDKGQPLKQSLIEGVLVYTPANK